MMARFGKSSMFGTPPAPARPKSLDVVPKLTLPPSSSGKAMLTQNIELGSTIGYDSDCSDHDSPYQASKTLSSPRPSDRTRKCYNNDVGDLAVGAWSRPNSAVRRLRDSASSRSGSKKTDSLGTRQGPDLGDDRNLQQRKVQQQHEARSWKTWEETSMNDCFALFTPKGLPRQVS